MPFFSPPLSPFSQQLTFCTCVFRCSVSNLYWFFVNPFLSYSLCSSNPIDPNLPTTLLYTATCGVSNAHPLVSPAIPVIIHLCHGSIALPMLGVRKMSVGVSLPHFTSPSSNGGQVVFFFFISTRADTKKKKTGGTLALTLKNK